ncbi:MAG TPA: DUF6789 family protein [Limnochordia bacterium]
MSSPTLEHKSTSLDLRAGIIGSLAGGVVFGIMMHVMGMMGQLAAVVGTDSVLVGWLIHLVGSLVSGCVFAFVVRINWHPVVTGLCYGAVLWAVLPLTLLPMLMQLSLPWSAAGIAENLPSLIGHLVYGLVTGWVYQKTSAA